MSGFEGRVRIMIALGEVVVGHMDEGGRDILGWDKRYFLLRSPDSFHLGSTLACL